MFLCSSMVGVALNLGRITDNITLVEEVNFSYCNLFTLEILKNSLFRVFLISCHLNDNLCEGMMAQGNVIYFHKVYVMDRVQTADKAEYLCME